MTAFLIVLACYAVLTPIVVWAIIWGSEYLDPRVDLVLPRAIIDLGIRYTSDTDLEGWDI